MTPRGALVGLNVALFGINALAVVSGVLTGQLLTALAAGVACVISLTCVCGLLLFT